MKEKKTKFEYHIISILLLMFIAIPIMFIYEFGEIGVGIGILIFIGKWLFVPLNEKLEKEYKTEGNKEQIKEKENISLLEEIVQPVERGRKPEESELFDSQCIDSPPGILSRILNNSLVFKKEKIIKLRTEKRLAELGIDIDKEPQKYYQILREEEKKFLKEIKIGAD
jgi:hypothetical protein